MIIQHDDIMSSYIYVLFSIPQHHKWLLLRSMASLDQHAHLPLQSDWGRKSVDQSDKKTAALA
jgi:hypothetical protein